MFKLVLSVLICALLIAPSLGFSMFPPGCFTPECTAPNPYKAEIAVDLTLDFDVCLELPQELCKYQGCEQAIIVQNHDNNKAVIDQTGKNFALIYQKGHKNEAGTTQSGSGNMALTFQFGDWNKAYIEQTKTTNASALIGQFGNHNYAEIKQK